MCFNKLQGSKWLVPGFPQAPDFCHGNSTFHLEFPAGNPAKNAGNLSLISGAPTLCDLAPLINSVLDWLVGWILVHPIL